MNVLNLAWLIPPESTPALPAMRCMPSISK